MSLNVVIFITAVISNTLYMLTCLCYVSFAPTVSDILLPIDEILHIIAGFVKPSTDWATTHVPVYLLSTQTIS